MGDSGFLSGPFSDGSDEVLPTETSRAHSGHASNEGGRHFDLAAIFMTHTPAPEMDRCFFLSPPPLPALERSFFETWLRVEHA